MIKVLQSERITVNFAQLRGPVVEFAQRAGLYGPAEPEHMFPTVEAAVREIQAQQA